MKIPVKGVVLHSKRDDGRHSHKLFITSWNGRPVHAHEFQGVTSVDAGHLHSYAGVTELSPSGVQHTHRYEARTSFNDGHSHVMVGVTGPVVPLPGGGHFHRFEGVTTVNGAFPHAHMYEGNTGDEIMPF